jgi:flagellar biosynthesis protein FlhA
VKKVRLSEEQDPAMKCFPSSGETSALISLISDEIEKAEKSDSRDALRDWLELSRSVLEKLGKTFENAETSREQPPERNLPFIKPEIPALAYEEKFTPEGAASVMNSCVLFCDVIVSGSAAAAGLKYDEENMFAPMIVFLEKGAAAEALVWAADNLGVPVVSNALLAKNLASCGKIGEAVPESSFRDVSMVFTRTGSARYRRQSRNRKKNRQGASFKISRPLSMELGESLFALTGEEPGRKKLLADPLNTIRKRLIRLLGFSVPFFRVALNARLKRDEYRILFRGLEAGRGRLELGWYIGKENDPTPQAYFPELMNEPENIRTVAKVVSSALIRHAGGIVRLRAAELLGRDEVEAILDAAEERYPVVTGEVKGLLSLGNIREILQSLVSEQVSIRHMPVILETLADWGNFGPAPSDAIIEQIRQSLKRQICLEYTDDGMTLRVLTLEPVLEKSFSDRPLGSLQDADGLIYWAEMLSSAICGMVEKGYPPVILCSPRARLHVKEATRRNYPDLAVLSYMEIPSDISVEPMGEICVGGSVRFPG